MTTALIIEPHSSGHHLVYLTEIVRGALSHNMSAVVAVGADSAGDVITERLSAEFSNAALVFLRVPGLGEASGLTGAFHRIQSIFGAWRFLSRAHRMAREAHRIDFVFIPYLDKSLVAISLLGSPFGATPFSGISMAQRFHFGEMGVKAAPRRGRALRERLFLKALRTRGLRELFVIDDTLAAFVGTRRPDLLPKIKFLPDPSTPALPLSKSEARAVLKLPRDEPLIVVYGSLDQRKGIDTLFEWLANGSGASAARVLLAGVVRDEIRGALESDGARRLEAQLRLQLLPRYIEAHEEAMIFSAADVVWIAYEGIESMSGVMVKAAQFKKAVLYRDFGLIGRYAARFGCPAPPERFGLPPLPSDVRLCTFAGDCSGVEPLPDHSWANACSQIFRSNV